MQDAFVMRKYIQILGSRLYIYIYIYDGVVPAGSKLERMGVLRTAHSQRNSSRRYVSKKPASRAKTAHKKPASAQQGPARSNANRPCPQCSKRSDKCVCYQEVPPTGKLSSTTLRAFVKFWESDPRRRYLSDCLDLRLIVEWIQQQTLAGLHRPLVILGVLLFRHFNRMYISWLAPLHD